MNIILFFMITMEKDSLLYIETWLSQKHYKNCIDLWINRLYDDKPHIRIYMRARLYSMTEIKKHTLNNPYTNLFLIYRLNKLLAFWMKTDTSKHNQVTNKIIDETFYMLLLYPRDIRGNWKVTINIQNYIRDKAYLSREIPKDYNYYSVMELYRTDPCFCSLLFIIPDEMHKQYFL